MNEIKGTQNAALVFLFISAIIVDAFSYSMISDLVFGKNESSTGAYITAILVSVFGGMLTLVFPVFLFKKFREPKLKLSIVGSTAKFGDTLKGNIMVSLSTNQTPSLIATLKLTRSQSDSIEIIDHGNVVWQKEINIDHFKPIGKNKCKGEFEILLRGKALSELKYSGSFKCQLFVRSSDPKKKFGEVFDIPFLF